MVASTIGVLAFLLGVGWIVTVAWIVLRAMWQNVNEGPKPQQRGFEVVQLPPRQ